MNAPVEHTLAHDAALASEHVLKGAVALARAEGKLLALRARDELIGVLVVGVGLAVAVFLVGLCLLLVALLPVAVGPNGTNGLEWKLTPIALSLSLSLAFALGGAALAWFGARRLRGDATQENDAGGIG